MSDEELEVLLTLDYPWYAPDEDTFHHQSVTYWPGQPFSIIEDTERQQMIGMSRPANPTTMEI